MSTITTTDRTPGDTSKSKKSLAPKLGYSLMTLEKLSIAWTPTPLTPEQKVLIASVAEARSTADKKITAEKVLHDLIMDALAKATPGYEKEAKAILTKKAEGETEEALQKKAEALQREMAKLQAMLAAKKK
jgi:hypothetical protein